MIAERPLRPSQRVQRIWLEEDEGYSNIENRYTSWREVVAKHENLFKRFVYENTDLRDSDLRQHRLALCRLMADGEELALQFLPFAEDADKEDYTRSIDQKLKELRQELHSWHGELDDQKDIPESFKQGIADIAAGRVIDMETALKEIS